LLFDLSWVSLLSVRLRHFSLNGRKSARRGSLRGGKKGVWREEAGTPCSIPLENPRDGRKRPASFTPGKKEAGGDEPHAGKWQPQLELLSKHGRRIRFQKHPIAWHPWRARFRNAKSESMAIYLSAFYTSIISGLSRKKWKGAQGIPSIKEGRSDDRCNRLEAPLKLFSFNLRIRNLSSNYSRTSITQISKLPMRSESKAIFLPSGDQAAWTSQDELSVSWVSPLPS